MIVFIERFSVTKADGHIAWFDLYQDSITNVQYFGTQNGLTPRYNDNGTLVTGSPLNS